MLSISNRSFSEAILDAVPQIVWTAAPDGTCTFLNRKWQEFTGQQQSDGAVANWLDAVHPDDQEQAMSAWRAAALSNLKFQNQFRLRAADGTFRWVLAQAEPELHQGQVVSWCGTCTDIHHQVLASQVLQSTEARLKRTIDHIPQMIWSALPDGSHDYFSRSWYEFTGVAVGSTDGDGWSEMFHPEDQERAWRRWRLSLATGQPYEIEYRLRHHNGDYRWLLGRALPERNQQGEIVRWHGTCTDIHEQVVAEQALQQSEAINRSILETTPDCIKLLTLEGTILYLNPRGPLSLEIEDGAALLGACWFDLLVPEAAEAARQAVRQTIESGEDQQLKIKQPTTSGREKWFDLLITLVLKVGEAPDQILVIARDITEQQQAECALRESERLHRGILEASDDCIKIIALDGTLELMNPPGLCAMELDSLDQVRGKDWRSLWPRQAGSTVSAALEEARAGRPARFTDFCPTAKGTPKWWDVVVTPMTDETGEVKRLLSISRDITSTREAADKLRWTSEHDGLTTLPNRDAFQAHLQAATLRAMESGSSVGLLLMDLDHFKHVNDTLGHAAGDHLLKTFGERLKASVRGTDLVARLGGDEFAVILEGVKAHDDLLKAGQGIISRLQAPIRYGERVLSAGASIGGAMFPLDAASAHELFKNADTALYALKNSGRGGTRMFHNYMREEAQKVASQLSLARVAINEQSVIPHYQQKIELKSGRIRGFEALLRWNHPTLGIQTPDTVAEAFKDYELAAKIGELMQTKVLSDIRNWQRAGVEFGLVSINAAPAEFLRDDYAERLLERLAESQVPGELIEVEVTEHVFLERGSEYVSRALKLLNQNGIRISLDDFGTGYSSLSHLRDFPVDVVKIDRSFISKMVDEPEIRAIVSAVVDLAASLSIQVVAEGIETEEQEVMLSAQGCALGQGYLFGRAVIAEEVRVLLSS